MHQKGHYGAALVAYAPVVFILTALGYTTLGVLGGAVVGTLAVVARILVDVLTPTGVRPFAPVRAEKYTLRLGTHVLADSELRPACDRRRGRQCGGRRRARARWLTTLGPGGPATVG